MKRAIIAEHKYITIDNNEYNDYLQSIDLKNIDAWRQRRMVD